METDDKPEEKRRKVMNQPLVDEDMRPSIDEHEAESSEDEVEASNPKPSEKEENLSEWEKEYFLLQLKKHLREERVRD